MLRLIDVNVMNVDMNGSNGVQCCECALDSSKRVAYWIYRVSHAAPMLNYHNSSWEGTSGHLAPGIRYLAPGTCHPKTGTKQLSPTAAAAVEHQSPATAATAVKRNALQNYKWNPE
jgi:hypothetical protein